MRSFHRARGEAPHTTPPHLIHFLFTWRGASLLCSADSFHFAFPVFQKQAALTSPWQTRRRNPMGKSRAGKILSTTHGLGNSWGALQAVGVRNNSSKCGDPLLHRITGAAVSLYTAALMALIDQMARCVIAQYPLTPLQFLL